MAVSRRHFFYGSLLAASARGATPSLKTAGYKSPNEKLNIAAIGAGGKGHSDITGCESENIVALADPDSERAQRMFTRHEKATKYADFRKMLDKEEKNIDAVIVSTPDFMHGTAAMWAMERGKHVYCQKPLTRTVWEARELAKAATKFKVATQMGNQGYSNDGTRQCAEMIWAGHIGNVTEVHAWTNRPIWPQGLTEMPPEEPVPATMDWDVWTGIQAKRPYTSKLAPFAWRGWFDYGCGALGDMACHILGAPNMALMLGSPVSVECLKIEGPSSFSFPKRSVLRFDFPARPTMPAVKIFWYDGCQDAPFRPEGLAADEVLGDPPRNVPNATGANRLANRGSNGSLFVGDKGLITTGTYGEKTRLLPAAKMKDYQMPAPLLTRSPGHYRDWIRACKGGERSCSDFAIAGPFTEWILLGVIALRVKGKLEWDASNMRFTNSSEANQLLKPSFRKGWSFV